MGKVGGQDGVRDMCDEGVNRQTVQAGEAVYSALHVSCIDEMGWNPVVTEFIVGVRGKEGIAMSLARALERW